MPCLSFLSKLTSNSHLASPNSLCSIFKRAISDSSVLLKQKKVFVMPPSNNFYVRFVDGFDTFQAIYHCNYKPLNIEREFNFNRRIDEPVDDFVKRIRVNLEKIVTYKSRKINKKKSADALVEVPAIEIGVFVDDKCFPLEKTCRELFFDSNGGCIKFRIFDQLYNVKINSPWVDALSLPNNIMVDFPVYPCKYEAAFVTHSDTTFKWFSSVDGNEPWQHVGNGYIFTPSEEQLEKYLKVVCTPSNGISTGPDKECISSCKVSKGPGLCPFEERFSYTSTQLNESSFRIVSYNILADAYAETDVAKKELFPYCPSHATGLSYRKQLYTKEILGYNADITCLQEVDAKVFHELQTVFQDNMKGVFCIKDGMFPEGVATFYNTDKFRYINSHRIVLGNEVKNNPVFTKIWNLLKPNIAASKSLMERSTALQVIILERKSDSKDKLIVANTHLYFHPDADHIRITQTGLCMEYIQHVYNNMKLEVPEDRISVLFCGDFNSTPDCGAYLLMTSKHVPSTFKDWASNKDEIIEGVELNQPLNIKSAYGTPKYTNFTQGFADCLDYIYYQTDYLLLNQVVPLPSEEVLRRHIALPSVVFPSDHIALVADFSWSQTNLNT